MPLYDFECDTCGHKELDELRPNNKSYRCPKCKEASMDRTTQYGMMKPKISAPSRTKSRWGDTFSCKI